MRSGPTTSKTRGVLISLTTVITTKIYIYITVCPQAFNESMASALYLAKLIDSAIFYLPNFHFAFPIIITNLKSSVVETIFIPVIKEAKYCTDEQLSLRYLQDLSILYAKLAKSVKNEYFLIKVLITSTESPIY